jgi:predicted deacylase
MLVLHYLKRLLSQAERRGELRGEIILVPVANPPGLAQVLLSGGIGRFDLASGRNFNRDFPDLAALAQPVCGAMPGRAASICSRCARRCGRRWRRCPSSAKFRPCATIC